MYVGNRLSSVHDFKFVQLTAENKKTTELKRKWMKSYCRPGTIITTIIITIIITVISIP